MQFYNGIIIMNKNRFKLITKNAMKNQLRNGR